MMQTVVEPLERYGVETLFVMVINAHPLMLLSLPQFYDGVMMYQNEVILGNGVATLPPDPEYR